MNLINLFTLLRSVKIRSARKGEILIAQGATTQEVFFIRKGIVRSFSIHDKGEEITFQLYAENSVFSNVHGVLFGTASQFNYQTLEDSKFYTIPYTTMMEITQKNSELLEWNRTFFGVRIIQQAFQRVESFVFLSPEQRYMKFAKDHPVLVNRVPDKYIAHVLGITPVSLSRIKRRIAHKRR
ncbi:cyclic nucleotide-binding domain-containing protein [bacterium]|nr:cyclic nucleotide-binding domain-containing protein [bacterium]